jgi:hypothetical protein
MRDMTAGLRSIKKTSYKILRYEKREVTDVATQK